MNRTRSFLRRALALLGGAALCGLLVSCAQPDGGPVVLRFWAMGREGEVAQELLADFQRDHPDIRLDIQQLPWTAAQAKLLTAFAGDVSPDLCQLGNTWVPQFASLNALEPLEAQTGPGRAVDAADYFPGIWDSNRIGGVLYGVPWYVDTRAMFYRADTLRQAGFTHPPRDWNELLRMMTELKRRKPQTFGILMPLNEFEDLVAFALQQDEPLLRDGGRYGNFRSAGFRRTLTFYTGMYRDKLAPALSNTHISNVWDEFGNGYFSFYLSGPWNIGEFRRRLPQRLQNSWMTAPLPGPNGPSASIAGGSSLVVFKSSRHKAEAWQVVEYLSRPEVQRRFYQLTGDLPPRRSSWTAPALAADKHAAAFREQLERAKSPPKVPEWENIATEMRIVAENVVARRMTIEQAVTELDARTDRILEKRRWMLAKGSVQ